MSLLLSSTGISCCRSMHFVSNHQLRTEVQKLMAVALCFHKINAGHLDGEVFIEAAAGRCLTLKLPNGSRTDDGRFKVELFRQLPSPLFAQVGWAEDTKAPDFAPI